MGSLYTQHYSTPHRSAAAGGAPPDTRTTFDLIYEGSLATLTNTKPLFAALIKGLTTPISSGSMNVNIVNAELIAKDRGLLVNEQHSRSSSDHTYSSLVTLRARPSSSSRASSRRPAAARQASSIATDGHAQGDTQPKEQVISGYVSTSQIYISRLDRFATSFVPEGNLLICHNYDSPGKIGAVGSVLGKEGVNINFMSVAPVSQVDEDGEVLTNAEKGSEALMILGVDREVKKEVVERMMGEEGILEVSVVTL